MRQEKLKVEQIVKAIKKTNGLISLTAEMLNVRRSTIHNYVNRYPKVRQAVEDARGLFLDEVELALRRAVLDGQGWAICFTLRTLGRDRGYGERQEIRIEEARPIELLPIVSGNTLKAFAPPDEEPGDKWEN
jgi:hypothetical protein